MIDRDQKYYVDLPSPDVVSLKDNNPGGGEKPFPMDILSAGKTDIGLVRTSNEDCLKLLPSKNLYIVCDGMGGHSAGEVASAAACDVISRLYDNHFDPLLKDNRLRLPRLFAPSTDVLVKTVRIANHRIFRMAAEDTTRAGMGTTIVAAALEEDVLTILHVGDSRAYRYYGEELSRLTIDHSWAAEIEQSEHVSAEEARRMVNRNVITRALGVRETVEIDVSVRKVVDGDLYILCSDGLCGLVKDDDIRRVVAGCHGEVQSIAGQLIQLAKDRGGTDNITVAALKVVGDPPVSSLTEMDTVTVDAEPSEYFAAEMEWVETMENPAAHSPSAANQSSRRVFPLAAAVIAVAVLSFIFYLILRE